MRHSLIIISTPAPDETRASLSDSRHSVRLEVYGNWRGGYIADRVYLAKRPVRVLPISLRVVERQVDGAVSGESNPMPRNRTLVSLFFSVLASLVHHGGLTGTGDLRRRRSRSG